jgi:hypothetical protein
VQAEGQGWDEEGKAERDGVGGTGTESGLDGAQEAVGAQSRC